MTTETEQSCVIEVDGLTRHFGKTLALDNVSLAIPKGAVFGLVGENAAGKTTLIKHLLGLLRPDAGTVRVFGMNPIEVPEKVLARIGYLSEDRTLPEWMRLWEFIRYIRAFYPNWDPDFADELRETFTLRPDSRIGEMSRGEKAKTGLLAALAHRPDLLLLDEPSAGLDAGVRRHILTAIIRSVSEEGRTVLFSSHLLDEVERVADHIAMIHRGRIILCDTLASVQAAHHFLLLTREDSGAPPNWPGLVAVDPLLGEPGVWQAVAEGEPDEAAAHASDYGAAISEQRPASLEEIFLAYTGQAPSTSEDSADEEHASA